MCTNFIRLFVCDKNSDSVRQLHSDKKIEMKEDRGT